MNDTRSIFDLTRKQMRELMSELGAPAFRGDQLFEWIYKKGVLAPDQMSNLPKEQRTKLQADFDFSLPKITQKAVASDGTVKFRLELCDGLSVEAVNMPDLKKGTSLSMCISSQVGCALGCTFCATGTMGFKRNLSIGEIVSQVVLILQETDIEHTTVNILFMGMGEPLLNLESVKQAISIFNDDKGLSISMRRITLSTVGIPHLLKDFYQFERPPMLAWSLHAPDEELRQQIMPVSKKYTIASMLAAIDELPLPARDRVTVEYILLEGVNDSVEKARELSRLLRRYPIKINLIPYNSHEGSGYSSAQEDAIDKFMKTLWDFGMTATVRRSRGADAAAACGQLVVDAES